ncbi:MAG: hypothetical protein V5A59_13695 [Bacteroidales bacterium]|nr:hypothetical protein [Bacteroidales bacterium]MBS3777287.1 hypothetical protein [Bacteroidales bacterium]
MSQTHGTEAWVNVSPDIHTEFSKYSEYNRQWRNKMRVYFSQMLPFIVENDGANIKR